MKSLLSFVFLGCFILSASFVFAQKSLNTKDSTKIWGCSQFKKGIYKNYEEFVSNSPSILNEFSVMLDSCYVDDKDSVLSFKYKLRGTAPAILDSIIIKNDTLSRLQGNDSLRKEIHENFNGADRIQMETTKRLRHIWGFCDGKNIYVQTGEYNFKYWKLINIKPFPYFKTATKQYAPVVILPTFDALSSLAFVGSSIAISSVIPAIIEARYVSENGDILQIDSYKSKKLIKKYENRAYR